MATYTWVGNFSTDGGDSNNWFPAGLPTSGDTAVFDGGNVNSCVFNISLVGQIVIRPDYDGTVDFSTNTEIEEGLSVEKENCITSSNPNTIIRFTGTPAFNGNTFYVEYKCSDMFFDNTTKDNILFYFVSTTVIMTPTGGVYPHCFFSNGFRAQHTPAPTSLTQTINEFEIRFQSIVIDGGNVSQSSSIPTPEDRRMKFILDNVGSHATVAGASSAQLFMTASATNNDFNGGYGTWTFQASSGFRVPVTGQTFYNGYDFTFENMILDSTANGSGSRATLPYGCILSLTNLTINNGVSLVGHRDGSIIHLVNRPTILGTWGFYSIADGIYVSNRSYMLGVPHGGTGLINVPTGAILFGYDAQRLNFDSTLSYDTGTNTLSIGAGGIAFSDGTIQTTAATGGGGGGGIGVNVQDEGVMLSTTGTTLNFVDGQHPVQTVPTTQPLCVEATGTGAVKTITIDGSKIRCNATDTLPTYLDAKLLTGANMSITLDTSAAATTGHGFRFDALNNKVKVTSSDTTEDFLQNKLVAGTGVALTVVNQGAGNQGLEITTSSSAAGFMEKFRHDQTPGSGTPFSPFRILSNLDIIETGSVNVFSPDTTSTGMTMDITINSCGNVLEAGKEIIFYGQSGDVGLADVVVYTLDTLATDGVRSAFIGHMHALNIGGAGGMTTCFDSLVIQPMDAFFLGTPSVVRVIDTGVHNISPAIISAQGEPSHFAEEPEDVRILLVVDYTYFDNRGRLTPNFSFGLR